MKRSFTHGYKLSLERQLPEVKTNVEKPFRNQQTNKKIHMHFFNLSNIILKLELY